MRRDLLLRILRRTLVPLVVVVLRMHEADQRRLAVITLGTPVDIVA